MSYYCRTCPRIIEDDDSDHCCDCLAGKPPIRAEPDAAHDPVAQEPVDLPAANASTKEKK